MVKKTAYVFMVLSLLILVACINEEDNNPSTESFIIYPDAPYEETDHIMVKDPYAFYNIAGTLPQYWGAANVHDPAIIKEGNMFYSFSTDANYGITNPKGIHIRKSTDLITWTWVGPAIDLTTLTEAIDYIEYNRDGQLVDFLWAPDIIKRTINGQDEFWLFYSMSSFGQRTSYLGVAKSNDIEGPYLHSHEILRTHQSVGGTPNAIDAAIYIEVVDGVEKMYMSYGSWSAGIYVIELDLENGEPLIKQSLITREVDVNTSIAGQTVRKEKLVPESSDDSAFGTRILNIYSSEAPYIIKEGNYYYLFVTSGLNLTYDYDTRVYRSDSLLGPYVDSEGNEAIASTNSSNFRNYGNQLTAAYYFPLDSNQNGYDRGFSGLGHSTAFKDGDQWFFASHYRGTYMDKDRFFLGIRKIHFIDGWPVVEANRYTAEGFVDYQNADLSGRYKVFILPKYEANSRLIAQGSIEQIEIIHNAQEIHLEKEVIDGWHVLSGAYSGRWRILDNNMLEINIDGNIYRGIINAQWSYEQEKGVLSFSLIDNKGIAFWGNRYE